MDTEDHDHFKTIASQSAGLVSGSQKKPGAGSSHSDLDPAYCLERTTILFACYRKDEAHDADIYCAAVAATLAGFSRSVVEHVTDPRTGIASENKFLPNIAEVRAACVKAAAREQLHAKPTYRPEPRRPEPVRKMAPGTSYPEMVAKYGRPIGVFESPGDQWNQHTVASAKPSPDKMAMRALDVAAHEVAMRAEYARLCVEPVHVGGVLISPELARQLVPAKFVNGGNP